MEKMFLIIYYIITIFKGRYRIKLFTGGILWNEVCLSKTNGNDTHPICRQQCVIRRENDFKGFRLPIFLPPRLFPPNVMHTHTNILTHLRTRKLFQVAKHRVYTENSGESSSLDVTAK